jgi:hypothetical protein
MKSYTCVNVMRSPYDSLIFCAIVLAFGVLQVHTVEGYPCLYLPSTQPSSLTTHRSLDEWAARADVIHIDLWFSHFVLC